MSDWSEDFELLRAFTRDGDQQAFAKIVHRHLNLVFSTALQKVNDTGAAEEIAQTVFVALARKAWQFAPDDSLPAWLHRSTVFESKSWLRRELRRRRREQTAGELSTTMKTSDEHTALQALVPLLDKGLLSLREKDRAALLLRFYESRSLRDVGVSLGTSEDAARKRVDGALEKLADYFHRRGFKAATVTSAVAALQHTAATASAVTESIVVKAALQSASPALAGLGLLLARLLGLTKPQMAVLSLAIAALPVAWQWNETHAAEKQVVTIQVRINAALSQRAQLSSDVVLLGAESGRLDRELADAMKLQARNAEAEEFRQRVHGMLADSNYRWQDDLPYVRIPKSVLKDIEIQGMFGWSGAIRDAAVEILGMTSGEKNPTERALGDYWIGVNRLMVTLAYETNSPSQPAGRVAKTVIVPPLGQDLKILADETRNQITERLGAEREKMLFGGWDQGAIQIFWPGNLWKISEDSQTFTVWVDSARAGDTNAPLYGVGWHCGLMGTSSEGAGSLGFIPRNLAVRHFEPWLRQFGITNPMGVHGQ